MVDHGHHLVRERLKAGLPLHSLARIVQQLVAHPPQQGLHHRTFVLKIQVKSAFGHLGPGGDVLHAGLGGAALQKQLVGCIQQGPALFLFFAFHGTHALGRFLFSLFFSRSYVALVGCLNHFSSPAAIVQERFLIQLPARDKKTDFWSFLCLTPGLSWL